MWRSWCHARWFPYAALASGMIGLILKRASQPESRGCILGVHRPCTHLETARGSKASSSRNGAGIPKPSAVRAGGVALETALVLLTAREVSLLAEGEQETQKRFSQSSEVRLKLVLGECEIGPPAGGPTPRSALKRGALSRDRQRASGARTVSNRSCT